MDAQRRIGQYREAPGSDIVKQGLLKKLKTMKKKYFILRSTSSSGPSRLDYYDSEKKFKTGHLPKRSIHLFKCFNINKKIDKHKSFSSIRRCGHSDNFFFMEVGRTAVTGSGELWMLVEDTQTSLYMHNRILESPRRARAPINRPQSTVVYSRSSHPNLDHIPSGGSSPSLEDYDDPSSSNDDYLPMSPGQASPVQRSRSRSPTPPVKTLEMKQGQTAFYDDYLSMTPASAGSEGQDSTGKGDGYMDMKPGSGVSSPGNDSYMSRTPPPSGHAPPDKSGYVSMAPPVTAAGSGYIDMTPGQRSRRRSQESIEKMSSSSRNSSNDSLKKLNEDSYAKKNFPASEYMDMGFDKRKTPSPNVQSAMSPQPNITGYVDMTIGTPKSTSRGVSPSSSTHSLGSSPASSVGHNLYDKSHSSTKIVKASGKPIQKSGYKTLSPNVPSENHLKVTTRLKMNDKRSPSSSGKESEDESYVQFKPSKAMPIGVTVFDDNSYKTQEYGLKSRPNIKVQHGYSKSYDSAIFSPEMAAGMSDSTNDYQGGGKYRHEEKHRSKTNEGLCVRKKINTDKEKALSRKYSSKSEKELVKSPGLESRLRKGNNHGGVTPPNKTSRSHSPTIEKKLDYTSMPDDDLFSNKMFTNKNTQPEVKKDDGVYLEYLPGDPATSTSVYNSKVSGTSKSGVKNSVANKGVDRIDKADKIGDRIGPKSPNLEARMEQPRRVFPDREYCEIDFPGQVEQDKLVNEQGNPDHVINKNESERLSNASRKGGENQTPKRTNSSRKSSEGFATRKHSESSVKTLDDSNGSKNGGVEKTPKKSSESQLTGKGESDMLKPSSDYMEADPAPLKASPLRIVKEKERSHESSPTKVKKKGTSDDFSYMDFDPASDKDTGAGKEEKSESITTPQRVKSYIAHSVVAEDIGKDDEIFVNTASNKVMIGGSNQGRSLSDNDRLTRKESDVDSGITFTCSARSNTSTEQKGGKTELYRSVSQQSGNNSESIDLGQRGESLSDVTTGIDRQTSQSSISSAHSTRKSSQDSMGFHRMSSQSSHESVSSVRKLSQDSSTGLVRKPSQSSQESIGSVKLYSLDKAHRQMVVKSTMPVAQEGQPIQDEGYCDIDYEKVLIEKDKAISNPCTTKMHHRSGSNSSSNSDRSRKVLDNLTQYEEMSFPADKLGQKSQTKCTSQQHLNEVASKTSNELHYADLELNNSKENVHDKSPRNCILIIDI
ncbi:IRS1-like protein, partial [Mya arenaria]